jgi:hypothetical protein
MRTGSGCSWSDSGPGAYRRSRPASTSGSGTPGRARSSGYGSVHDPAGWEEFRQRYFDEIQGRPEVLRKLAGILRDHTTVTFLFGAHDEIHNNAAALKEYLEQGAVTGQAHRQAGVL